MGAVDRAFGLYIIERLWPWEYPQNPRRERISITWGGGRFLGPGDH